MHQQAIIAGKKVIEETLKNHFNMSLALLMPQKLKKDPFEAIKIARFTLAPKLMSELDIFGTRLPLLLTKIPQFTVLKDQPLKGCTLFMSQQDPRNVGALLRSAAAFSVNQIILGPGSAHPFHPQSTRAASGCVFDHVYFKILKPDFSNHSVIGLDMRGENLKDFVFPKDFILVPGVEGPGLDENIKLNHKVTIQISPNAESLNVAQATAIALYEATKGTPFLFK